MGRTVLVVVMCTIAAAAGAPASELERADPRVRGMDAYARWLIESAVLRSATVRALADRLETSDVVAYVQVVAMPQRLASTRILNAEGPVRYLLVSIHRVATPDRLMELLGHELQHVAEIADAPDVRSDGALAEHYRRIGMSLIATNTFETEAAQRVTRLVQRELAANPASRVARRQVP